MEMMKELMKKAKRVWTALVYVLTLEINSSSSTPATSFKHSKHNTNFDDKSFNDYETYWHDSIYYDSIHYSSYDDSSYHHSYYDNHGLFDKFGSSVDSFGSFSFDFHSFND